MRLYIATSSRLPSGGAATNRKIALGRGFMDHGFEVLLLSYGVYNQNESIVPSGEVQGIPYLNLSPQLKSTWYYTKQIAYLTGMIRMLWLLLKAKDRGGSLVWSNATNWLISLPLFIITRIKGMGYFIEYNEHPFGNELATGDIPKIRQLSFKYSLSLFDRVFTMTYTLRDYFIKDLAYRKPIQVVANAVDLRRFEIDCPVEIQDCITYVGSFSFYKDGVDLLLLSFSLLPRSLSHISLLLAGFSNSPDTRKVQELIDKLELRDRVEIIFDVPAYEIPALLKRSLLLVLTRTPNPLTQSGFPTKLVEYLASQRPVLVTNTSDIGRYLQDGESAYIPAEFTSECVAEKLEFAINDPNKETIGFNGRMAVDKFFNPKTESKKIIEAFR